MISLYSVVYNMHFIELLHIEWLDMMALSIAVHNVFFVQFFSPRPKAVEHIVKSDICYTNGNHVTYVCPNLFGRGENRENSIFASLEL